MRASPHKTTTSRRWQDVAHLAGSDMAHTYGLVGEYGAVDVAGRLCGSWTACSRHPASCGEQCTEQAPGICAHARGLPKRTRKGKGLTACQRLEVDLYARKGGLSKRIPAKVPLLQAVSSNGRAWRVPQSDGQKLVPICQVRATPRACVRSRPIARRFDCTRNGAATWR